MQDDYYHTLAKYPLQEKIANTVARIRNNNIEKAKAVSEDPILDVASYTVDNFDFKLGNQGC